MSKLKDEYIKLYGNRLKETAVGDYINELEQQNKLLFKNIAELSEIIEDLQNFICDNGKCEGLK